MDDAELAAYQAALVSTLVEARSAAEAMRQLAASKAARPYASYVARFDPRLVDAQAALARRWCRREGEPSRLEDFAGEQAVDACRRRMRSLAAATVPLVEARWVRAWLRATQDVPAFGARAIGGEWYDDFAYYLPETLAYARPLDLLARAGLARVRGKKILELAFRSILPHCLLAAVGARSVAASADPMKPRVYAHAYAYPRRELAIVAGSFPSDAGTRREVGAAFDAIVGWNAIVREPSLAVADLPQRLAAITKRGGLVLLYDVSSGGALARSPFDRRAWGKAGLRVVAFERSDSAALRDIARVQEWPKPTSLRARYTLLRRA